MINKVKNKEKEKNAFAHEYIINQCDLIFAYVLQEAPIANTERSIEAGPSTISSPKNDKVNFI